MRSRAPGALLVIPVAAVSPALWAASAQALELASRPPLRSQLPVAPACDPASIKGVARDGETLTASRGACSGVPAPTLRLRWYICDANLQGCSARTGASGERSLAYRVRPADVNGRLVVQQVATSATGSDQDDTPTAVVAAIPPSATPTLSGLAREGEALTGSEGFLSGTSPTVVARRWLRCAADGSGCLPIDGATGERYALTAEDAGRAIRFQVAVAGPQETVEVASAPTAPVEAAPDPVETQPPPVAPAPEAPAPEPPAVDAPARPRLLRPFPTVVVAGSVFPGRAVVSRFLVLGPTGAAVEVRCRGRSCPARRVRRTIRAGSARLGLFEIDLLAGTVLEVRVTKGARVGKFVRLRVRPGQAPARRDLCLTPGQRRPASCPAGVA